MLYKRVVQIPLMPSCLSLLCRTEEVQTLSDCHDKLQYHRREPTLQPSWSVCRRGRCVKTELTPRRLLIFLSNHLSGYLNKNYKSILRKLILNLGSSNNNPNLQASSALSVRPSAADTEQCRWICLHFGLVSCHDFIQSFPCAFRLHD